MFRGSLTNEQIELLKELRQRKSLDSLSGCLKGIVLDWFQTYSLAQAIITKGCLISLDTGLGKMLLAIAYMSYIRAKYPNQKSLFVTKANLAKASQDKIKKYSNLKSIVITGEQEIIQNGLFRTDIYKYDVIILTHQALGDYKVNAFLIENRGVFKHLLVDESHELGHKSSFQYQVVEAMAHWMESRILFTATPVTVSLEQAVNQLHIIDPLLIHNHKKFVNRYAIRDESTGKIISYQNLHEIQSLISGRYVGFSRAELGLQGNYKTSIVWCNPTPAQRNATKSERNRLIKGQANSPQITTLRETVISLKSQGKRGLIYINLNETKKIALDILKSSGLKVGIIDGSLSKKSERDLTQKLFNSGEFDCLISNTREGLDLPCDYILFYELDVRYKQIIGRAERGLEGNDMDIIFILTRGTVEIEYFINNIYKRSLLLKEGFGKSITEMEESYRKISQGV